MNIKHAHKYTKSITASTPALLAQPYRKCMCCLPNPTCLILGQLSNDVIYLCRTHFALDFMHNWIINTSKELEQLFPQ